MRFEKNQAGRGQKNSPPQRDPPIVQKADPNASPIIQFAISKPGSVVDLTQFVTKQIQEKIESVDGVGDVQVFGGRARQIRVYLDPNKLKSYNLSVNDVNTAISSQNQELPSGRLNEGPTSVTLRTLSKITTVEGFGDMRVAITRQIHEAPRAVDREEIDQLRLARQVGDLREVLLLRQQVDQRRLADVGTADEGELREHGVRARGQVGRADGKEGGLDFQKASRDAIRPTGEP